MLHITISFSFYSFTFDMSFPNRYFRVCQRGIYIALKNSGQEMKWKDMIAASFPLIQSSYFMHLITLTLFVLHKDKTSVCTQMALISMEHQVTLLTECTTEGARSEAPCIIFKKFLPWNLYVIHSHNTIKKSTLSWSSVNSFVGKLVPLLLIFLLLALLHLHS